MLINDYTKKVDELIAAGSPPKRDNNIRFVQAEDVFACGQGAAIINKIQSVQNVIDGFVKGADILFRKYC